MFYIFTSTPNEDHMARYERDKLDEIFGEYNATQLVNGISVFANGGIHVNAAHAAMREADDILKGRRRLTTPPRPGAERKRHDTR